MKRRKQNKIIGCCLIVFVLFYYFINKNEKVEVNDIDVDRIEDFDLIVAKGQSVQSKLISLLKFSTEDYSHIGVLYKEKNRAFVLHATPDGTNKNGIRYDDLQTFIDLSNVSSYIVLRYQDLSFDLRQNLKIEFLKYKTTQAPFDFEFDNFNHEKIYCSELVWLIFSNAGLLERSGLDLKTIIYPKYFLEMKCLYKVGCKKSNNN